MEIPNQSNHRIKHASQSLPLHYVDGIHSPSLLPSICEQFRNSSQFYIHPRRHCNCAKRQHPRASVLHPYPTVPNFPCLPAQTRFRSQNWQRGNYSIRRAGSSICIFDESTLSPPCSSQQRVLCQPAQRLHFPVLDIITMLEAFEKSNICISSLIILTMAGLDHSMMLILKEILGGDASAWKFP